MPSREEFRQMALEDQANSTLARPKGSANRAVMIGVATVAVGLVGWMFWSAAHQPKQTSMLTPDADTFRTTIYQAPVIDTPPAPVDNGKLVVQPPPPPPPPPAPPPPAPAPPAVDAGGTFPPLAAPGPLAAPPDLGSQNDDAERRRREEEERLRWERLKSPMLVTDGGGNGPSDALGGNPDNGPAPVAFQETDPNRNFLNQTAAAGVEISQASRNPRIDALVAQGTMIRGILETAIQSDLPGMLRAVTTEDVRSFDGSRVLIPSGTRLIGEYKSGMATGQTRVFIVWTRLLRSDGVSVQLGSYGTDNLGRTGLSGEIDNHYAERFGSAILLSIVGGGAQYIGNLQNGDPGHQTQTSSFDPLTGITTTTTSSPNQGQIYAQQIAAQQISQTMNQIASEALRSSISIPPTIHVDQGARIMVFVRRDLDFSSLYPDPIKEMMKEIRSGRVRPYFYPSTAPDRPFVERAPTARSMVTKP